MPGFISDNQVARDLIRIGDEAIALTASILARLPKHGPEGPLAVQCVGLSLSKRLPAHLPPRCRTGTVVEYRMLIPKNALSRTTIQENHGWGARSAPPQNRGYGTPRHKPSRSP
jgi:hypothetical protein